MEKTIICLSGPKNTGKTKSVWDLYELLGGSNKKYYPDVVDSVKYQNITIGCMSVGDPGFFQQEDLEKLLREGCDIVVAASRTRGEIVKTINDLAKQYNYKVIRFSQLYLYEGMREGLFNLCHDENVKFTHTIIDKLIAGEAL